MATTILKASDLFEFEVLPTVPKREEPQEWQLLNTTTRVSHPKAGEISIKNISFPHLHLMEMGWNTAPQEIELLDSTPSNQININFMLGGSMYSRFPGIRHDLDMQPLRHNLVHLPEGGGTNQIKGGDALSMLHLTFEKDFFVSAVGQDDAWAEQALTNLHHQRPFSGVNGTGSITPQMAHLIDGIRNCPGTGPLRNLLIQSKALELLALQIEQFKTPTSAKDPLRPEEAEKLHQLKIYLDTNFLSEMSLSQLSRQCLLNEFKLKKGFKSLFGTTVFNYLRKLRMEYAGQMLKDCTLTIEEIADALGYEHAQHFSIAFKKYSGSPPSHYRTTTDKRQVLV